MHERGSDNAKVPVAFRMERRTVEALRRRARELGQPQTALAQRYLEEGLRLDEHPLIQFREGACGRRAALAGSRLDVASVVTLVRENGNSPAEAASYLEQPIERIEACVRYYAAFPEEIDGQIERERAVAERERELWERRRALLGG